MNKAGNPRAYSIVESDELHFLTLTVVDWLDVFTRPEFARYIIDSLNFCVANKGLRLYGHSFS